MLLPLSRIRLDGGTQPRAMMHEATVAEYAEVLTEGGKLPPVVVYHDGEVHWLADGFHRVAANKRVGMLEIDAEVRPGTRRDAMLASFSANATHGLPRTNEDKRRVVLAMLDDGEWSQLSNRAIARACAVTHTFVTALRSARSPAVAPSHLETFPDRTPGGGQPDPVVRTVSRNGTTFAMDVGGVNKDRAGPRRDPDADLEKELAAAEAEVGAKSAEVEALTKQLAEAQEQIENLTQEVEYLSRALEGDAATELKKIAAFVRGLERVRDDLLMQNSVMKRELARIERDRKRTSGMVMSHA